MITQKDVVFLRDYMQLGYLNHYLAASSFLTAGAHAFDFAVAAHQSLDLVPHSAAREQAVKLCTASRVQTVMVTRIYSEYVATIEDFGAFLFAVRNRNIRNEGIFAKYLNSQRDGVNEIFRLASESYDLDLGKLLRFPSVASLRKILTLEDSLTMERHYLDFAESVADIAKSYQAAVKADQATFSSPLPMELPSDWHERIYVALELSKPRKTGKIDESLQQPLMPEAFNKIKHRYMVIESLDEFLAAEPRDTILRCAHQSRRPDWPEKLLQAIGGIVTIQLEIAAMIYKMHECGVKV